jgi:hypothetical protein
LTSSLAVWSPPNRMSMMSPGSSRTIRKIPIETRMSVGIAIAIRLRM